MPLAILLIATWGVGDPMHAHPYQSTRDCEAARAQIQPTPLIRWTRCVLVVAR